MEAGLDRHTAPPARTCSVAGPWWKQVSGAIANSSRTRANSSARQGDLRTGVRLCFANGLLVYAPIFVHIPFTGNTPFGLFIPCSNWEWRLSAALCVRKEIRLCEARPAGSIAQKGIGWLPSEKGGHPKVKLEPASATDSFRRHTQVIGGGRACLESLGGHLSRSMGGDGGQLEGIG
jgi:hypothetical protein